MQGARHQAPGASSPTGRPAPRLDRYAIGAVDRALGILELLRDAGRPLHLRDISRRLKMVKSTGYRLLCTLERRGYVERFADGASYHLGVLLGSYGNAMHHRSLTELALPRMHVLREHLKETINLGVLRDGDVLYLEMLESRHSLRMAATVGSRSPLHSTALGKAIAAYLPDDKIDALIGLKELPAFTSRTIVSPVALRRDLTRTRIRGYAEENGETELEASCIAAPIFDREGHVMAALSASGPTSRVRALKQSAIPALIDACTAISRDLGYARSVVHRSNPRADSTGRVHGEGRPTAT